MYKLAACLVTLAAWATFFIMGVSLVEHNGDGDGGDGGDGGGDVSLVADFGSPTEGSGCMCTGPEGARSCTCTFTFSDQSGRAVAVQTTGKSCQACASGVAGCYVCTLEPVLGNDCSCEAGGDGNTGDGQDGDAKDGDGTRRSASVAADGDAQDGDAADGDSAPGVQCQSGTHVKAKCVCRFGSYEADKAKDGDAKDGDAKDGDAKDGDAKDGDAKDGDAKDGDAKDGDAKDGDAKDGDAKDGDAKDGDAKDGDAEKDMAGYECCCDGYGDGDAKNGDANKQCRCKLPKAGAYSRGDGDARDGDGKDGDAAHRSALAAQDGGDGGDGGDGDGHATFRPKYGVVMNGGQGCTGRGGCKSTDKAPYYVWAQFMDADRHVYGGHLNFEWRGDVGKVVSALLLAWMGLLLLLGLAGVVLRGTYHAPLCAPVQPGSVLEVVDRYSLVPLRLTVGELVVSMWIVGWLVLCFLVLWNHAWINNLVAPVGRGFGGMVAGLLVLQLFPVSRKSVVLALFGMSYERALRFHARLGVWIFVLMLVHFFCMLGGYAQYYRHGEPNLATATYAPGVSAGEAGRLAMEYMVKWKVYFPHGPPLAGFLALIVMSIIFVTALFRRRFFNTFVVVHSLYAVLYVMAWIHYPTLMIFSAVPVLLYAADVLYRTCTQAAELVDVQPFACGITRLTFRKPSLSYSPAQWVYVRVASAEKLVTEWHPFSVSSIAHTGSAVEFTVHCKTMGDDEWTGRVAKARPGDSAAVQGPFGQLVWHTPSYDVVYLCAGGVGVTPVLGFLSSMSSGVSGAPTEQQKYVVVWSYRGKDTFEAFQREVAALSATGLDIEWHLHDTTQKGAQGSSHSGSDVEKADKRVHHKGGRPNWAEYMEGSTKTAAVFVCGPAPVVHEVQTASRAAGHPVHFEVFEF